MVERAPHGSWRSPITAASIVGGAATIAEVVVDGDRDDAPVWFAESRPSEGGRIAVLRLDAVGTATEVTPAHASVRSRVHEYGGGAWWVQHDVLYYVEQADQQLRMLRRGDQAAPVQLTQDARDRYADLRVSDDSAWVLAVRERHEPGAHEPANELVAVPTDGSGAVRVLVSGPDFVSSPRLSPDGHRLAWIQWFHPNMPWDTTELWVAAFADGRISGARCLLRDAALVQPEWSPDGALHVLSDASGWWRVVRVDDLAERTSGERDWGDAPWVFGESMYAFTADGALVTLADVEPVLTEITCLRTRGSRMVAAGASWASETQVVQIEPDGTVARLRAPRDLGVDPGFFPPPERITFPTGTDDAREVAHAWFYAPANPAFAGPEDERPPLLVMAHGGPTTMAQTSLRLPTRFWTSRGFAVVDVDYRGSTGFGRAYRRALDGRWGIADVEDCIAAARFLAARGDVDRARVAIRGGSAGGLTVLGALLAAPELFAAATALYAVSDLAALARDTHKFEARYLDTLVAPYPEATEVYAARSPIGRIDELRTPLLVLHGRDDPVVPVDQSEALAAALAANGVPHRLVVFEGEGHGLRRAESQTAALEAELSFYVEHLRLGR